MNASCLLESRFLRALLGVVLFAFAVPFAAAQQSQTPPGKPTKAAAQQAGPTVQGKSAPSPESEGESEDYLRQRAEWFYGQRAYPLGFIPPNARLNALKEMDVMIQEEIKRGLRPPQGAAAPQQGGVEPRIGFPFSSTGASIGPTPENNAFGNTFFGTPTDSGRVSAISVDPTNSSIVYVGGANGGIWKSTDAGAHFTPLTDAQNSLAIGSIAIAPSNASIVYVGTGEQDFLGNTPTTGAENYYGVGILKSTDGGATWTNLQGPFAGPLSNTVGGARIPAIAVHPTNSSIVLAGALFTSRSGGASGIYRSTDGGTTWTQVISGPTGNSVVFDPTNGNVAYAALSDLVGAAANGVYKSTDAGATFTKLAGGLPTSGVGRIELAIARSSPTTVYASIANGANGSGPLLGLFKTTNGGTTWTQVTNGSTFDYCGGQCFYSHAIAVSPTDPNTVIAGGTAGQGAGTSIGQTLFRSTDGGMTFTDIHTGASGTRLHSDQHAIVFSVDGTKLYDGNDGGAWRTDNPTAAVGTLDWVNLNGTLTLAEFYPGFAVDENNANRAFGGTQDNGTIAFSGNALWDQIACGDGAANLVDRKVPSTVYVMCTSGNSPYIQRSFTGGGVGTFTRIQTGISTSDRREFIPFIAMDHSSTNILYTPTFRVYRSMDWGTNWTAISPDLTADGRSSIAVLAVADSNSNVVYAATDDARIWRTTSALSASPSWTPLNTPDLPNRFITSIVVDSANPDIAYLGISGFKFGADQKGHVFKTTNAGVNWQDISGNLPNIPVNAIVLGNTAGTIFVGTDIGVFMTTDGGTTWTTFGTSLPRVAVLSLAGTNAVGFAATHGRGVFAIDIFGSVPAGPVLTSISPSFKAQGSASFTLTADGANFTAASKVEWDHSQTGVTTNAGGTANQLTATIDTSLLTPGVHDVTVFDAGQVPNESQRLRFAVTGTAPVLTSISPTSVATGGPSFPLTANGSNFSCGGATPTVVDFGGDSLTPTTCSATSMQVTVPASDIATSRSVPVQAFTTPPGGGQSSTLAFVVGTPPTNDNFANAQTIASLPFTDTKDTTSATTEAGEPVPSPACAFGFTPSASTKSIWYKITPSTNQLVTFTTQGETTFGVLQVVTGALGSFTPVPAGCNAGSIGAPPSAVTVNLAAGTTYFIMYSDFNGAGGTAVLNASVATPPPNDNFANAIGVGAAPFTNTQNTLSATTEAGEPVPACTAGQSPNTRSMWYKYVPSASGFANFTTNGSTTDTIIQVVTGSLNNFTAVPSGCADANAVGVGETVTVAVTSGTTYFIMISDFLGNGGTAVFNFVSGPAPQGNPVPTLTSLVPSSGTAGGPGFMLTVNGTSFVNGATVNFAGSARVTTFVNSTQVTAAILAGDIATAGTDSVTVTNPAPGGGTSNALNFTANNPVPTVTNTSPASVAAGSAAFTLTVNGTNFVSSSVVNFKGTAKATTFVNATQLTAPITAADVAAAGNANVTVTNPAPGGGTSSPAFVFVITSVPNPVPAITSLSPSPATAGAGFTLTVNGSNFVSNSVVNVNGAARTTAFVSSTQLTATIPASDVPNAGVVDNITVFNPAPGGGTSNVVPLSLTNPAPAITSLSPPSALVNSGGFTLTVNGNGFESTSVVNFGGAARATTFVNSTQLTATILAGDIAAAGNVNVTVTNPGPPGGGTSAPAVFAVNNPAPVLTSILPTTAAAGSAGFTLTANGSNFVASSAVQFNGVAKVTTFVSAAQLTAAIPASDIAATGNFPVTVVTPGPGGGTSAPQTFTVTGPTITTLSPSSASAGGAGFTLTVNGSNFASGATVTWNGSDRVTTFVNAGQLTAAILTSDLAVPAGTATVQVRNPGGVLSNTATFTINGPAITTLSPSSTGVGGPAFTLTVNGSNFVGGSVVKFNGVAKVTTFVSATQLTAAIPASDIAAVGTPPVTVMNPGGATSNAVNFTVAAPTITPPLSPTSVLAGSGAFTLNVTGTNFVTGSAVTFNGNARTTTFNSSTSLSAAILAGDVTTAGTFAVVVQNPGPVSSNSVNFTVNNPVPTTTSLSPTSVIAGSGAFTLTVNGTNFVNGSVVNFKGTAKTTTFVNATQLTASIAAADVATAGNAGVTVTNPAPGGGTSNAQTLTVVGPTITSLSPSSATVGGAAFTLTVNGTNYVNGSTVQWGGSARTTTFVSATQVTAAILASDLAVPMGITVAVTVVNPGGAASNAQNFTINNPSPTITGLSPTSAPAGAAFTLTVNGTGFVANSVVNFGSKAETTTFVSSTKLTAAIPAGDVTSGGTPAVTVTNAAPGGGTSPPAAPGFTLTDFMVSGPAAPVTVTAGQPATFTITVAAAASGPFANAVTFSASGLPAATTASFSPASVTPGSTSQTSTLTITTKARSGAAARGPLAEPSVPVGIPWMLNVVLVLMCVALLRRGLRTRRLAVYLPLALLALGVVGIVGCSNAGGGGTPAGTSQITVTATSGTAVHATMVTLTVK